MKDAPHDDRFRLIDAPLNVPLLGPHVVVPEHPTARNMPGPRFPLHRVVRPLSGLLALEFVGKRGQREHDLVGGGVERPLAVLEIKNTRTPAAINCFSA